MTEVKSEEPTSRFERLEKGSSDRQKLIDRFHSTEKPQNPSHLESKTQLSLWRKLIPVAAGTSILIPLLAACGGNDESGLVPVQGTTTIEPHRPVATQTIEGGPPSAQTPIVETSPSQSPTQPTPTETPEVTPSTNWEIVVDTKEIAGPSDYPFNRTVEQDIAIIQSTIDTLPQIGNLKIVLTNGKGARIDKDSQTINIGRESFPESMKGALIHDYFHFLDPLYNSEAIRQLVGQENFDELVTLRNQALEDPNFSPNIPDLDKIFSPEKRGLSWDPDKKYTPDELAVLTTLYPDAFWLVQARPGQEGRHIFDPYIADSLNLIKQFTQGPGIANYDSLGGHLEANKDKVDQIRALDPIMNRVFEILEANKDLFVWENLLWITDAGYDSERFNGKYTADWWKGLCYEINGVLGEAFLTGDESVISLFPSEATGQIKINLEALKADAESERFADLGKATLIYDVETSITPYLEEVQKLASETKTQ